MASRFLITGTQIGIIIALVKLKRYPAIVKIIRGIVDNQWVGSTHNTVDEDVETVTDTLATINPREASIKHVDKVK